MYLGMNEFETEKREVRARFETREGVPVLIYEDEKNDRTVFEKQYEWVTEISFVAESNLSQDDLEDLIDHYKEGDREEFRNSVAWESDSE